MSNPAETGTVISTRSRSSAARVRTPGIRFAGSAAAGWRQGRVRAVRVV